MTSSTKSLTNSERPLVSSHAQLYNYLEPALRIELEREGTLAPHIRAEIARDMRRKLASFAAYIPSRLVYSQLQNPVPGRVTGGFWHGSLLFADLSGFTALSSQLSQLGKQGAEEVSSVVNQLFNALVDEVLRYQGALLKFGGDALTAFFDEETLGASHAFAATLSALAMQERMKAFSALETRKGTFRLQLRVGVHSGKVFAAEVGDTDHVELVVTGSEVNRVATAQEIAAPGEVVISDYTAALLENAKLAPRDAGFQSILSLPEVTLPAPPPDPISLYGPDDIDTLALLAKQIVAIRPYLMRNLPSRFLDASVFDVGEFRPVTVLFANFHDFSAILQILDEKATIAANMLNAYFRRAQSVVHRYDGIVNKVDMYTHGDKLMVLFGAPVSHEDDSLRAVRCALDMKQALEEANEEIAELAQSCSMITDFTPFVFKQCIGINTGTVFAGRVGGAKRYEYTVMGSDVNLSARLMSATDDDTVLISSNMQASVQNQIALSEQPPIQLKGLPEPVVTYLALHMLDVERSPVHMKHLGISRAPLVGRTNILNLLLREAGKALHGDGRVLAIVGEAGIGKSRLTEELTQNLVLSGFDEENELSVPDFQIYTTDCQSYEQSIPYATIRKPLQTLLNFSLPRESRRVFDSGQGDSPLQLLESSVGQLAPELLRFTPLLSDVLGVAIPESPLIESLSAEQRHDRLQELVIDLFLCSANNVPLLLSLEDIQWADASSLELLERLSKAISHTPLLILLNYRPDPPIPEPWTNFPTTTRIELDELPTEESQNLLEGMLGGEPPSEIVSLLDRTQGNPFFIEELVRTLIVSEALARDADGTWKITRPLDQISVPTSIEGLIYARLDRLDERQYDLVQVASVIGRRFYQVLMKGVYSYEAYLNEGLQCLAEAEMIALEQQNRDTSYIFRHALLRDVAYEGILYARRRDLHRRVAHRIEEINVTGHHDESLAILARHYLLAEDWMMAFYYLKEAGVQAQKRYANREAISLFATALDIAPHLQQEPWRIDVGESSQESSKLFLLYCPILPIEFQIAELYERSGYIQALLGEGELAQKSNLAALEIITTLRAEPEQWHVSPQLAQSLKVDLEKSSVRLNRHLASLEERHGNYEKAFEWIQRGMVEATSSSREELGRCYLLGSRVYYSQANFDRSLEWAKMALSIAKSEGNTIDQAMALLRIGVFWYETSDFAQAIEPLEEACRLFEQSPIIGRYNDALNNLGIAYERLGQWKDAIRCYGMSLQISENIGDALTMARTSNNLALVLLAQGELQRASELYEYSCNQFRRVGFEEGVACAILNRGEVLLLQDQPAQAMELFDESVGILERINSRLDLPEVLRLSAEALLMMGDKEKATAQATKSLSIAQELGMTTEEATARRTLGQIALNQNDVAAASTYFGQSFQLLEQLGERYEIGKVLFCQGKLALLQGEHATALETLKQSEEIFKELDAVRDLKQVQDFLAEHMGA